MATHSNVLAWRIPGMGSHRVRHDWSDLAAAAVLATAKTWGRKKSDMMERLNWTELNVSKYIYLHMLFNNTNNSPKVCILKKTTTFHGYWEACRKHARIIFLKCGISTSQKQVQDPCCNRLCRPLWQNSAYQKENSLFQLFLIHASLYH